MTMLDKHLARHAQECRQLDADHWDLALSNGHRLAVTARRDDGFLLATSSGQAPVTGAQEGVGTRIGEGDATKGAREPWVAPAAALAFGLTGRLVSLGVELGPRH